LRLLKESNALFHCENWAIEIVIEVGSIVLDVDCILPLICLQGGEPRNIGPCHGRKRTHAVSSHNYLKLERSQCSKSHNF
jgi:hypothetical protein